MSAATHPSTNLDGPWPNEIEDFDFQPRSAPPFRAWERVSKSSFAPRHKGRKVWKRYDLRVKETNLAEHIQLPRQDDEIVNGLRPIKRLRFERAPGSPGKQVEQRSSRYITTLRDQASGTPRRKVTKQTSLKRGEIHAGSGLTADAQQTNDALNMVPIVFENASPADHVASAFTALEAVNGIVVGDSGKEKVSLEISSSSPESDAETSIDECSGGNRTQLSVATSRTVVASADPGEDLLAVQPLCSNQPDAEDLTTSKTIDAQIKTNPSNEIPLSEMNNLEESDVRENGQQFADMTINITLLRDENSRAGPTVHFSEKLVKDDITISSQIMESPELDAGIEEPKAREVDTEATGRLAQLAEGHVVEVEPMEMQSTEELADASVEENAIREIRTEDGSDDLKAEVLATDVPLELEARFSDDTNMLKEILNRAQARKAARSNQEQEILDEPASPRRSPRKILAQLENNFPTPTELGDEPTELGPSSEKQKREAIDIDDVDESASESTSCRRSIRTRVAATVKLPADTPTYIPVRRGDGIEPVVLHKCVIHELMILTRTNTKRNRGLSKAPKYMLRDMARGELGGTLEDEDVTKHPKKGAKKVSWDDQVGYCAGEVKWKEKEGKKERLPRIKRVIGLGEMNGTGTPAAKKVVMAVTALGPRHAGRRRG